MNFKLLALIGILGAVYATAYAASLRGYGYAGHKTYKRNDGSYYYGGGPSFFYWGGSRYYDSGTSGGSLRGGSPGGPSVRGGGPSSGK
ncbi:MAG: hypothetical protein ACPGN3_07120 [Opitutales bacterium]